MMIADRECSFCWGCGRIHSPNKNGDPFDEGIPCPKCDGTGVEEVDLEEELDCSTERAEGKEEDGA